MSSVHREEWHFAASNGEGEIFARAWLPGEQPKAVVQIAHGMSEHSGRYDEFATFLCNQGYLVVANDHAGHGKSAQGHLGSFAARAGGLNCSVADFQRLFDRAAGLARQGDGVADRRYVPLCPQRPPLSATPSPCPVPLPRILFGQSMGSLMAALYAERFDDLSALILSATPSAIKFSGAIQLLTGIIATTRGQLARSSLLEKLTGTVAHMTDEQKTQARHWLTRDTDKIKEFNDDPLGGFDYSAGGYHAMMQAYRHVNAKNWGAQMPDIPLLIVAGEADQSSGFGKGPRHFARQLAKTGHSQVELKLFEDARHELVNELGRQEIYAFLTSWINQQVAQKSR